MGIFDRIILALYTFALGLISFFTVLIALGWSLPLDLLRTSLLDINGRWTIGIIGAAFFVVSIRLLYFGLWRRRPSQTVVHENELGEVRISLGAIESLVRKVARQVKGVREIRSTVINRPGGITVYLRGTVSPETNIPEVSDEIQKTVRTYVKNVVGIGINEVQVYVENISNEVRRGRVD